MPRKKIDYGTWTADDLKAHVKELVGEWSLDDFITAVSEALDNDGRDELIYRLKRDINDSEAET